MSKSIGLEPYQRFPNEQELSIIGRVRDFCAGIHTEHGGEWTERDAVAIACMFNEAEQPYDLFRFVDEKPGHDTVGYKTSDGVEWFYILRQMRNRVGSGLLETMRGPYDGFNASGEAL